MISCVPEITGNLQRGLIAAQNSRPANPGSHVKYFFFVMLYVNHYYFYIDDADFGPLFLKVCSYAPWGIKLCLNGHEWAKRQLEREGIGYEALDNGFLSCAKPEKLQRICDCLGPDSGPAGPDAAEGGPEKPVEAVQGRPRAAAFQHRDLLSQGEDFKGSVATTADVRSGLRQGSRGRVRARNHPCNIA